MTYSQLSIFSWQTEKMAEGFRKLADFDFDAARQAFQEIIQKQEVVEQKVHDALEVTLYWENIMGHCIGTSRDQIIPYLYREIIHFDFSNTWGIQSLRKSLLDHLVSIMYDEHQFYITADVCLSDLLIELDRNDEAERVLTDQMKQEPGNNIRFRLAQIQWVNGKRNKAKINYVLGLLLAPGNIFLDRIESPEIQETIDMHGPEMAPAYGWVNGALPLVRVPETVIAYSVTHRKALRSYQLLGMAEESARVKDAEACFNYRKKLKETAPDLYDVYFTLLSKRRGPM
ncbi:MAG: hypothetical protein WEB89_06770 [Balneolales bacterium]